MPRHKREEQDFLENIERLIAGEEVSIGEDADEDLRTAIEFSRTLSDLHTGPSVEFKDRLKSRLLMKLTEQEVAARQRVEKNWFRDILDRLVPQSPVWRTATISLVMIVAVVTVMWRTGMFTGVSSPGADVVESAQRGVEKGVFTAQAVVEEAEAAVEAPPRGNLVKEVPPPEAAIVPLLDLQVTPAEPFVSEYGREVNFDMVLRNTGSEAIAVTSFPPRITIVGGGALQPVRILPEGNETVEIAAFESIEYDLTWHQHDDGGNQVSPGWYTMYVGPMAVTRGEESMRIGVPVEMQVLVQYPQGAMEKSLEIHKSLTVSEVTVTLERLEMSALEAVVYAIVSPGYGAPEEGGPGLPIPGVPVQVIAWYSMDGGPAKEARNPGERFLEDEDSTRLSWKHLDPVPSDARTLTFTITQIGEWEGPWEFRISPRD